MRALSDLRQGGAARSAALSFAVLHLALAIGVSHDVEVHRLEAAARLPQAFHHHVFSLAGQADDVRPSIVGECLACHLSRVVPRLLAPAIEADPTPEVLAYLIGPSSVAPKRVSPSPQSPRAPPTPSV